MKIKPISRPLFSALFACPTYLPQCASPRWQLKPVAEWKFDETEGPIAHDSVEAETMMRSPGYFRHVGGVTGHGLKIPMASLR